MKQVPEVFGRAFTVGAAQPAPSTLRHKPDSECASNPPYGVQDTVERWRGHGQTLGCEQIVGDLQGLCGALRDTLVIRYSIARRHRAWMAGSSKGLLVADRSMAPAQFAPNFDGNFVTELPQS